MAASIKRNGNKYFAIINGEIVSQASYYIYPDVKDFNWINLADIDTKKEYRRRGYAQAILQRMLLDLDKAYPSMGQYLLVKCDNIPAIRLYQKFNFEEIRVVMNKKTGNRYSVMCRGNSDRDQLLHVDFGF